MKTRIISACVMLPLLIVVYLGGYLLMAAAFLVGLIGLREFYNGFEAAGSRPSKPIGYTALVLLYGLNLAFPSDLRFILLWLSLVVIASMVYGFNVEERKLEDMTSTLLGIVILSRLAQPLKAEEYIVSTSLGIFTLFRLVQFENVEP